MTLVSYSIRTAPQLSNFFTNFPPGVNNSWAEIVLNDHNLLILKGHLNSAR